MAVRNILLDTNAYTAFKRGQSEAIHIINHAPIIGMSAIVLGELWGGFAAGTREEQNKTALSTFLNANGVTVIQIDEATAERYANVYQKLKSQGKPIPTNDMWIAATALQHDLALFTYDKHFQTIPELLVGNKLEAFIY